MKKSIDSHRVIGIIGPAKNTGKTTTLNWLIKSYKHLKLGLTSIGLDGEHMDQVYFLPKPRILVYPGMIIATTSECLDDAEIEFRVIRYLGIDTAIGEVLIIEVLKEGYVVLAGPSTNSELKIVIQVLKKYAEKIFVDGALNRVTFTNIEEIEGIVLTTGASLSPVMEKTILGTQMIIELLQLPKLDYHLPHVVGVVIQTEKRQIQLHNKRRDTLMKALNEIDEEILYMDMRGAISEHVIDCLIEKKKRNYTIVGADATRFVFDYQRYRYLKELGIKLAVRHTANLLFITINPYRPTLESYDPKAFKEAIMKITDLEVINVREEEQHE